MATQSNLPTNFYKKIPINKTCWQIWFRRHCGDRFLEHR